MHPILYSFGSLTIYTYGFFVSIAFLTAFGLFLVEIKRRGIPVDTGIDFAFWVLLAAIIGSRLAYVLVNIEYFLRYPGKILMLWEGGLVWYGAFLGALLTAIIYFRIKRLSGWLWVDMAIPYVALGQGIGRIGCLMAGCCYGTSTDLPWGVTFTVSEIAPLGVALHPTQLYDMFFDLGIFVLLVALANRVTFRGQQILSYIFLYGATRSIVEIFRGDPRGSWLWGTVTTSQLISIVMVIVGVIMYFRIREKNRIDTPSQKDIADENRRRTEKQPARSGKKRDGNR